MALYNTRWDVTRAQKAKSQSRANYKPLYNLIGIFAVSFSAYVWYAIFHFLFHLV